MTHKLHHACLRALRHNLGTANHERVLVVTDPPKRELGEAFAAAAREVTGEVEFRVMPVAERNGVEASADADVALLSVDPLDLVDARAIRGVPGRGAHRVDGHDHAGDHPQDLLRRLRGGL